MTKSQQIRDYKEANPKQKPKDIAKACGVTTAYVYQVLHNAKHRKAKKSMIEVATPTNGQKIVREEIERLHAEIERLQILQEMDGELMAEIRDDLDRLNNDIVGYRAVISYLQGQLDGVTV